MIRGRVHKLGQYQILDGHPEAQRHNVDVVELGREPGPRSGPVMDVGVTAIPSIRQVAVGQSA